MKLRYIIVLFLVITSGVFYYNITGHTVSNKEYFFVARVIDGDTFEIESGHKVRMIGINTPEKNMKYYNEAKNFTKNLIENRSVEIESFGFDRYGRILGHVFIGSLHLNEEILKQGYGSLYYYEKDRYYDRLDAAEQRARMNGFGIWKASSNKGCLKLIELKYKEDTKRCSNEEVLKIENICQKSIDIVYKDDATHVYREKIAANSVYSRNFSCIWNDDGDSLYVWDSEGLILFYRY
jgi:hypothetical protein